MAARRGSLQELLLSEVASSRLPFGPEGQLVAACMVYRALLRWGELEAERTNTFDRIVEAFQRGSQDQLLPSQAYWLTNHIVLYYLVPLKGTKSQPAPNPTTPYLSPSSLPPPPLSPTPSPPFPHPLPPRPPGGVPVASGVARPGEFLLLLLRHGLLPRHSCQCPNLSVPSTPTPFHPLASFYTHSLRPSQLFQPSLRCTLSLLSTLISDTHLPPSHTLPLSYYPPTTPSLQPTHSLPQLPFPLFLSS
ncbi:unnamed protein product [Closterium sp. Naga37s-1]|nr:unnamed protein product [Closterium sp. Naga37s-1]